MDSKLPDTSKEGSRIMYNPQTGGTGPVPYSKIESAVKDGLEFTTHMYNPQTKGQGWVADSLLEKAKADGLQNSGVPMIYSPYEEVMRKNQANTAEREDSNSKILTGLGIAGAGALAGAAAGAGPAIARGISAIPHPVAKGVSGVIAGVQAARPAISSAAAWAAPKATSAGRFIAEQLSGMTKIAGGMFGANEIDDRLLDGAVKKSIKESK